MVFKLYIYKLYYVSYCIFLSVFIQTHMKLQANK